MDSNIVYYLALLALIIIAFLVVKRVASCLIKSVLTIVLIAVGVAIWYLYLR